MPLAQIIPSPLSGSHIHTIYAAAASQKVDKIASKRCIIHDKQRGEKRQKQKIFFFFPFEFFGQDKQTNDSFHKQFGFWKQQQQIRVQKSVSSMLMYILFGKRKGGNFVKVSLFYFMNTFIHKSVSRQ